MTALTLNIMVEGITEQAIVRPFLEPYWSQRFAKCQVINFKGSGNLINEYVKRATKILSQPGGAVLILIDVRSHPFASESRPLDHVEAYTMLRTRLYARLGHKESDVLGIFPVVIEPETWLLADPTIQNQYLKKKYTHPEHFPEPAEIIAKGIPGYRKGESAKRFFDQASAEDVYNDNCPHFVYLIDWLKRGISGVATVSPVRTLDPSVEQQIHDLQKKYDALTRDIERNLRLGQTAAAGVLKTDAKYFEAQINALALTPPSIQDIQ